MIQSISEMFWNIWKIRGFFRAIGKVDDSMTKKRTMNFTARFYCFSDTKMLTS